MGGVDRANQNISLYRTVIRGKKWYFPIIMQCIDMAEQNAWLLHKNNDGKLDHLAFRRQISAQQKEAQARHREWNMQIRDTTGSNIW